VPLSDPVFIASIIVALFVFFTHRANIGRLRRGEEHRFKSARTGGMSEQPPRIT
jgi:hypothetical protein